MSIHRFSFPTAIHFGPGARAQVAAHLRAQGMQRPLIVTDRGIAALPMLPEFTRGLESLAVATFSEVFGNPDRPQVAAGVAAFRAHRADCIIGFGGGAALDVAKAIALMIHHPGELFDYEDEKPGARAIDQQIPYWVALPTTSGTGSEVGRSAVISDETTHIKKIIFSPRLLAPAVFADPELTLDLPAPVTAATGMDALTHCAEAYLARGYHPICDGIALEGLGLAAQNLLRCVRDPRDVAARGAMMMSSLMGAIAFQKGLGVTHSCAHALGTVLHMHHGLANGVMIDHALRYNLPTVPERFTRMSQVVGLSDTRPESFIAWLAKLKMEVGIAAKLSQLGVRPEQLPELVRVATADACHPNNPRPCTAETFQQIFGEAL